MLCGTLLAVSSAAFAPMGTLRVADASTARHAVSTMQFKSMQSTDTAAAEQADRAKAAGMTPAEYEEATRMAANKYLADNGAHIGGGGSGVQTADFLKQLWNVDSIPAISDESKSDSTRVLATVYEIGGPLTNILSTSVAKQLPLIPHVGIRVHG